MTLGEFYRLLRATIARGSSLDPLLPLLTKQAVRWLERNNTFPYMVRNFSGTAPPGRVGPFLALGIPDSWLLKSIEFVVFEPQDGRVLRARQAPEPFSGVFDKAIPSQYWINWAESELEWNAELVQDVPVRGKASVFTEVPDDESASIWLSEHLSDLLLFQCMVQAAVMIRDDQLAATFSALRDQTLRTAALQQQAQEQQNSEFWMGRERAPYSEW